MANWLPCIAGGYRIAVCSMEAGKGVACSIHRKNVRLAQIVTVCIISNSTAPHARLTSWQQGQLRIRKACHQGLRGMSSCLSKPCSQSFVHLRHVRLVGSTVALLLGLHLATSAMPRAPKILKALPCPFINQSYGSHKDALRSVQGMPPHHAQGSPPC